MTFLERYNLETTWHGKAMIMEIYHLAMCSRVKTWTITRTAEHFECSIGLVSENLRLAQAIHLNDSLLKSESRQDALRRINGRSISNGAF